MHKNTKKQVSKLFLRLFLTQFSACYIIIKIIKVFLSAICKAHESDKFLGLACFRSGGVFGVKEQALVVFTEKLNGTCKNSYF